jgi:hypothetical protein
MKHGEGGDFTLEFKVKYREAEQLSAAKLAPVGILKPPGILIKPLRRPAF